MYQFSDFASVQALPDVVTVQQLAQAIGLSPSRTYEILDEAKIPYLRIYKRKIIFKEHLLQGLSDNRIFTDVAGLNAIKTLPEVFRQNTLLLLWEFPMDSHTLLCVHQDFLQLCKEIALLSASRVLSGG